MSFKQETTNKPLLRSFFSQLMAMYQSPLYLITFPTNFSLTLTFSNWHCLVSGSPYVQEIAELTSPSVDGPGLKKGIVAEPCVFNIDARGFPGHVTVDIQGKTVLHSQKKESSA